MLLLETKEFFFYNILPATVVNSCGWWEDWMHPGLPVLIAFHKMGTSFCFIGNSVVMKG